MTDYKDKQEEQLYKDVTDNANEIIYEVQTLIDCEWDSNTVKQKLIRLVKENHKLWDEIEVYDKK